MKFDQFAYWLQGYFELTDNFDEKTLDSSILASYEPFLTPTQVTCIKSHIKLYAECAKRNEQEPDSFMCWLDGSLTYFDKLPIPEQKMLVVEIRKRLNDLFIHKIDPEMPGDKESLQDIHDGKKPKSRSTGRGRNLESRGWSGRERRLMC